MLSVSELSVYFEYLMSILYGVEVLRTREKATEGILLA